MHDYSHEILAELRRQDLEREIDSQLRVAALTRDQHETGVGRRALGSIGRSSLQLAHGWRGSSRKGSMLLLRARNIHDVSP